MQLCVDATRFGCGLDGAVDIAFSKGLQHVEYSFAPFKATSSKAPKLGADEKKYLCGVKSLMDERSVEIACLNLDYCLDLGQKQSVKQFGPMIAKLALVAQAVGCGKITFAIHTPESNDSTDELSQLVSSLQPMLVECGVKLLLRLSTPAQFQGQSLKQWKAMEPQDWRNLMAACPGLSLSLSPADCLWLGIDYLKILPGIIAAVEHIEAYDVEINRDMLMDSGMFGPLWWRYRLPGKGQVDWRQLIEALKLYEYQGAFSIKLADEFIEDSDQESLDIALDSLVQTFRPWLK